MRTIAQNICYYRNKKQLTQQQLADKLNVSHHTISKWECGNNITIGRGLEATGTDIRAHARRINKR